MKKNKTKTSPSTSFIKHLNKYELAFMYKYKYGSMMAYNQNVILKAMKTLNISVENIDTLINEYESNSNTIAGCRRCGSGYAIPFEVVSENTNRHADDAWSGKMKMETQYECGICGFNYYTENAISKAKKINKLTYFVVAMWLIILVSIIYNLLK